MNAHVSMKNYPGVTGMLVLAVSTKRNLGAIEQDIVEQIEKMSVITDLWGSLGNTTAEQLLEEAKKSPYHEATSGDFRLQYNVWDEEWMYAVLQNKHQGGKWEACVGWESRTCDNVDLA